MMNSFSLQDRGAVQAVSPWVKSLNGDLSSPLQLICFPFAGGGTSPYRFWLQHQSTKMGISAVLLPGRETRIRETPVSDINLICDSIITALLRHYHGKRLIFFGHSMGSMLAYEVAIHLESAHQWPVRAIFVSGRKPPHKCISGDFHQAPEEDFVREIQRLGGTPTSIFEDAEMRNILLPMLRSDYALLENYRLVQPRPLGCAIYTCCGDQDTEASVEEMRSWQDLSRARCAHRVFQGGHFYLSDKNNQKSLSLYLAEVVSQMDGVFF